MQTHLDRSDKTVRSREQVLEEVRQLVAEQISLPLNEVREEHDLITDLGYDSLDLVELAMELEEHFNITVPDAMSEQARTVGQITDGVMQLVIVQER